MSDSTTNLDLIYSNQSQKELTANMLFDALSPASSFGRRGFMCSLLTWAYYGGKFNIGGTNYSLPNGTLSLVSNTVNYVELDHTSKNISLNQTGFSSSGTTPLYSITTGSSTVISYTDFRNFLKLALPDSGYTLPIATESVLGGVKSDGLTVSIDSTGVLSVPKATNSNLGIVQVDGSTISSNSDGIISINKATTTNLGGVKSDGSTVNIDSNGILSVPKATNSSLGVVKVDGSTITINSDGVISSSGGGGGSSGVSKIIAGTNITISSTGSDGTGDVVINSSGGSGGSPFTTYEWVIPSWTKATYYYFYSITNASGSSVNGNTSLNSSEISNIISKASNPSNFRINVFAKCTSGSGSSDSNGYYTGNIIQLSPDCIQAGIHQSAGALLACINDQCNIPARISLTGPVGQVYPMTASNWELHILFDIIN